MSRLLIFTLAAPLMAFGDVAPGERRVGHDRPGRSALLGLIAASLGLRREDARQGPLARSLAFATRLDAEGVPLSDYHTTQSAPAKRKRRFATRREELAIPAEERTTILSQRVYRADAAFTVAALPQESGPFDPAEIAGALIRPQLPVHLGRRSCPFGLPSSPALVEAETLAQAFAAYDEQEDANEDRRELRRCFGLGAGEAPVFVAAEAAFFEAGLLDRKDVRRQAERRDEPGSRLRWQFSTRIEFIAALQIPTTAQIPAAVSEVSR